MRFYLFLFLFYPLFCLSDNNYDICRVLEDEIVSNRISKELNKPEVYEYSHGFYPVTTVESNFNDYLRDKDNYIILGLSYGLFFDKFKIPPLSSIIELNHQDTSKLSDGEIDKIYDITKPIHAKFKSIDNNEISEISSLYNSDDDYAYVGLDFEILDITQIDSKNSSYKVAYTVDLFWGHFGIDEIIQEIKNKIPKDYEWQSFTCPFTEEEFKALGMYKPEWQIQNLITLGDQELSRVYQIQYVIDEQEESTDIIQKNEGNSLFKNYFDFSAFPFDKQNLVFKFAPKDDGLCYNSEFDLTTFSENSLKKSYDKMRFIEWNKESISYNSYFDYNVSCEYNDSGIQINFYVERNYNYFLTKILFPIFLILIISWSVFWIRPNLIEPRLTVSIVCLLSLIAYNFVVDDDLPKLSYLTVMDIMILLSYFFSTLPTLITILNHVQKNDEIALGIDRKARIFIPLLYVFSIIIITFLILHNSKNTVSKFNFFA